MLRTPDSQDTMKESCISPVYIRICILIESLDELPSYQSCLSEDNKGTLSRRGEESTVSTSKLCLEDNINPSFWEVSLSPTWDASNFSGLPAPPHPILSQDRLDS